MLNEEYVEKAIEFTEETEYQEEHPPPPQEPKK